MSVRTYCSGWDFLQSQEPDPDCLIVDVRMPGMSGLELVSSVVERYPGLPIILMTGKGTEETAVQALQAGAASYVPKSALHQYLVETVQDVLEVVRNQSSHEKLMTCLKESDFSFALANEYALVAEHYRRDAHSIIRMVREGYPRAPLPLPGPAGGPCLSKDGYFLIEELTFPDFVLLAWKLNDSVPVHMVDRVGTELEKRGGSYRGSRVTVLGRAFKADIDETLRKKGVIE